MASNFNYRQPSSGSATHLFASVEHTDLAHYQAMKAVPATDKLASADALLTPKFVAVSTASSGSNTVLAAVAAKKIRVLAYTLVAAGAVTAQFKTAAAGAALTGAMSLITGTPVHAPFNPLGHFETVAADLLNLVLGGAVQVSGHLCYVEIA